MRRKILLLIIRKRSAYHTLVFRAKIKNKKSIKTIESRVIACVLAAVHDFVNETVGGLSVQSEKLFFTNYQIWSPI